MRLIVAAVIGAAGGPISQAFASPPFDPSPVRHVHVQGADFGYRTVGEGPPLVLIMGFGGTMTEWDPGMLARLATEHRLIVFDNRGAGESYTAPVDGLTIAAMADDTAAVIRRLVGRGRAHVLGWSMGGYIAQSLALRHPRRVKRLVLAGTDPGSRHAVKPSERVADIVNDPNTPPRELVKVLFPREAQGRGYAYLRRVGTWPGIDSHSFTMPAATFDAQLRANGPLWYRHGTFSRLPGLSAATLVADGASDRVVPPRNSRILNRHVPESRLKLFPDSGHAFLFQYRRRFAHRVKVFLR
jgi:pimeloyl-ACP methyl ester carboxylesterase